MQSKENSANDNQQQIIEERNSKMNNAVVRRYIKKRFLGKGGFAHCYQVQNLQTKKISAIKILSKDTLKRNRAKQKLVTQIKIHKLLEHGNVVLFDHVFEDNENVYIVLELCGNYTLNEMMKKRKRITESQLQYYLYHIIQGLIYIHRQKVVHRDLKLGNIMLAHNMQVKIGDFGLAAKLDYEGERRKTICGTPNYLAPQIVSNLGHSYEVDVWSLGVVAYTLLYGRPPFQTSEAKKTYKRIKECQYTFDQDIAVSQNARSLISKVLVVDWGKRPSLEQILVHPFMATSRIPKQMPVSVLTQAPNTAFLQQNGFTSVCANKLVAASVSSRMGGVKSEKGISERVLLFSAAGYNPNLLCNRQKEEIFYSKNGQKMINNNYFRKPQSSKTHKRTEIDGCLSIYVKKWVDYSSKYGLGYLLSDGSTGILFNDSTKMAIDRTGQQVDYISNEIEEKKRLKSFRASCNLEDKQMQKKLTLMQYFRKYLGSGGKEGRWEREDVGGFVYMKKWSKSEEGILFRLSNKVLQANFNDKSQMIICADKDLLLYSNPNSKHKEMLDLASPELKRNSQISQRIQHLKVMLQNMQAEPANDQNHRPRPPHLPSAYPPSRL